MRVSTIASLDFYYKKKQNKKAPRMTIYKSGGEDRNSGGFSKDGISC